MIVRVRGDGAALAGEALFRSSGVYLGCRCRRSGPRRIPLTKKTAKERRSAFAVRLGELFEHASFVPAEADREANGAPPLRGRLPALRVVRLEGFRWVHVAHCFASLTNRQWRNIRKR
jgi:hypothetical protein